MNFSSQKNMCNWCLCDLIVQSKELEMCLLQREAELKAKTSNLAANVGLELPFFTSAGEEKFKSARNESKTINKSSNFLILFFGNLSLV